MNWLKKFMMGRYGSDQLSVALIIVSFLISFATKLINFQLLIIISYVPLGICIFRMLSRDIEKRRMENYRFSVLISPLYAWTKQIQNRIINAKTQRYVKCPSCKAKLRVPKDKGKINITCPKCKVTQFSKKT